MKDPMENGEIVSLDRLLFRRQFILGSESFAPNEFWSSILLQHGLYLSVHHDLPYETVTNEGVVLTLIGHALDPFHPLRTNLEVLQALLANAKGLEATIEATKPLAGRWVLLFQDARGSFLFTDPCGFRQVFYHADGEQIWAASQPELIRAKRNLIPNEDEALLRFLKDPAYIREESAWIGSNTLYSDCFHLMPNHYLVLERAEQKRFYFFKNIQGLDKQTIVEAASTILQGTMTALAARGKVSMALTAGWDSRLLLAASRPVCEQIEYFVCRHGEMGENHPDIQVPMKLSTKLGLRFDVKEPGTELPEWFVSSLSQNVSGARVLPKTQSIFQKLMSTESRININGNGSEICRSYYDKYGKQAAKDVSSKELAGMMFGKKATPEFAVRELQKWKDSFDGEAVVGSDLLDLLYWEQKMGNWGAQYPAEQDIAIEEISPFNDRLLLETILSAPRSLRSAPDYVLYQEMIRHMWPEALSLPVNPLPKGQKLTSLKKKIHRHLPYTMERMLKKYVSK